MIYSSWEIECDRLKLVIMGHFLSFISPPPQKTQKIKTLKKWKKFLEISSFYTCVPKMTIIWGVVPETRSKPDILFCNLGPFFALLPPHNLRIKILKKWKKYLEMTSFYTCVPKITIILCLLPETWSTTEIVFCHFGPFFALYFAPLLTQKLKFGKNVKITRRYYPFKPMYHKW